ncbi:MAG: hypothetical protein ACK5YR_01080 [Pirellula sp.]|jgi:hypothetical protein
MNRYKQWLRQLRDAQAGRPTEDQAVRTIAINAAACAVLVGLLANIMLIGMADPLGLLPWVFIATALISGLGGAYLVLGVHYKFGFRPVAALADALVSTVHGVFFGAGMTLVLSLILTPGSPLVYVLCPLPLAPIGAFAMSLFRAWSGMARVRKDEVKAAESRTDEHTQAPAKWDAQV